MTPLIQRKADAPAPASGSSVHIPPLLHADVMVLPDDDVIEASDADDMARLDETLRHLDVFPARCRVPARMVMHGDETRRRQFERLAEHVARMDDRRVEPADEQRLPGDELVLRVQIQAFRLDINTINDFWILSIHFASISFMDL